MKSTFMQKEFDMLLNAMEVDSKTSCKQFKLNIIAVMILETTIKKNHTQTHPNYTCIYCFNIFVNNHY